MHHREAGFQINLCLQIDLTRSSLKLVQKERFVHESHYSAVFPTPVLHLCQRYDGNFSPLYLKCKVEMCSLTHCLWSCGKIQKFWHIIEQEINKISH